MTRIEKGFTLVELVLVIAILGVMAVAGVTITMNTEQPMLNIATDKVRADVEHARSMAMMRQGTTFGVFFDVSENEYTVYQGTTATPVANPQTRQDLIEDFSRWTGVTIANGADVTVEFNSFGVPTIVGGNTITLSKTNFANKVITINTVTGLVSSQ